MKKKFMAMFMLIAAVAMLIPGGVRAAEPYKIYEKGADANFFITGREGTGYKTLIMEGQDSTSSKYVRGLVYGWGIAGQMVANTADDDFSTMFCDPEFGTCDPVTGAESYSKLVQQVREGLQAAGENAFVQDGAAGATIEMITLDEAVDLFGATLNGEVYTIPADNRAFGLVKEHLTLPGADYNGFYTQTVAGESVWAVLWNGTTYTIEKVPAVNSQKSLAVLPILMVDKDEDCQGGSQEQEPEDPVDPVEPVVGTPSHCYVCAEDDYRWAKEDEAPEGCEINNDIDAEAACTGNPETGVNDYVLPITIAVCAAAIALTVITKKDLFRKI